MKLDLNLIRVILAHTEQETLMDFLNDASKLNEWQEGQYLSTRLKQVNQGERIVYKHLELLIEAGFIKGVSIKQSADLAYQISLADPSLTLSGYSLLESLRADGFIDKVKKFAKEKSVPLTVETISIIAKTLTKILVNGD